MICFSAKLTCNHPGCEAEFTGITTDRVVELQVRKLRHRAADEGGWHCGRTKGRRGGVFVDYCPEHKESTEGMHNPDNTVPGDEADTGVE